MSLENSPERDRDIQKRTVRIPPTRIDKKLIQELGEYLEGLNSKLLLTYSLDSKTKEIEKSKVKDFIEADWGKDIRTITIKSKTALRIKIDFQTPRFSEYSVYGRDATWVSGLERCIGEKFSKNRLGYAPLKTKSWLRFLLISLIDILLCTPIYLALSPYAGYTNFVAMCFLVFLLLLISLTNWMFPYFEYGEPIQKNVRKWIWFALIGTGIIPSIILKYFFGL
jgi:hypothetical protein